MQDIESIPIKSAVVRNALGRIQVGSGANNPLGRPSVGKTVAETFRKFLTTKDKLHGNSRLAKADGSAVRNFHRQKPQAMRASCNLFAKQGLMVTYLKKLANPY